MKTSDKVVRLAEIRKKQAASPSSRQNVFDIRSGGGKPPDCSIHMFTARRLAVPPKQS